MPSPHLESTKPLLSAVEKETKSLDNSWNETVPWDDDNSIKSRDAIENRRKRVLLTFWPLALQTILSILLAAVVLKSVDGGVFDSTSRMLEITQPDGSISRLGYTLLQTDVTTVISAGLTAIRFLGGLWTAGTVRRCVFILLEKDGLTLGDIQWMLTWTLPARFNGKNTDATFLISLVLLFSFPSQFSSPLLTGSISWTPSHSLFPGAKQLNGISFSAAGESWVNYAQYPDQIGDVIIREAGGISDLQWGLALGRDTAPNPMKRALPSAQNLPISSTLHNLTLPAFIIHSLRWIEDPTSIPDEQRNAAWYGGNFSPFRDAEHPFVAILPHPNETWGPNVSNATFPKPFQVSETRLLVTLVDRILGIPKANGCPTHSNTKYYGPIPPEVGLHQDFSLAALNGTNVTNCFAFANVNYSAGVITCTRCRMSSFLVADSGNRTVSRDQLQDDTMVLQALGLAAKLTTYTAAGNVSVPSSFNNIDNYVRAVLSRSYQASWVALTNHFQPTLESLSTDVDIALTSSLQASVSPWRVYLWLLLNLLLGITGIISWFVQKSCDKPFVINSEVAMLLLDSQNIHNYDKRQLYDLSILTPEDITQVGLLRLELDRVTRRRVLSSQKA
ncbi:hypothetical protein GALMADRAFT_151441 [Galerina marginata CBS 339.88]|uniref:Transmembrane protein n=1 Tax=Galerina marginata (strain CBS 339.88) TaxID=685588 RepID=A0A067TQN7_GALM3|nr:hypothetical protein GALMADRAFT_151441 [Galerina marginata CBS 339.88]